MMYELLVLAFMSPPELPEHSRNVPVQRPQKDAARQSEEVNPEQMAEAANLFREGVLRYETADYEGAIEKFSASLSIVKENNGDEAVRLPLLYNIATAHEKLFSIDKDVRHLRRALTLYRQYRDYAAEKGDPNEQFDVETKIVSLERKLSVHEQIQKRQSRTSPERGNPPPPPPQSDLSWRQPRNLGLGLTIGGGAAMIGGIVALAVGSGYEERARSQVRALDDLGLPADHPAWAEGDDFISRERRKGAALMGVGGSLAVVGAVGAATGAYYLIRAKRVKDGRLSATPRLSPGFAGVQLTGRF